MLIFCIQRSSETVSCCPMLKLLAGQQKWPRPQVIPASPLLAGAFICYLWMLLLTTSGHGVFSFRGARTTFLRYVLLIPSTKTRPDEGFPACSCNSISQKARHKCLVGFADSEFPCTHRFHSLLWRWSRTWTSWASQPLRTSCRSDPTPYLASLHHLSWLLLDLLRASCVWPAGNLPDNIRSMNCAIFPVH